MKSIDNIRYLAELFWTNATNPKFWFLIILVILLVGGTYATYRFIDYRFNVLEQSGIRDVNQKIIVSDVELNKQIDGVLDDLLVRADADRVGLFKYHNTVRSLDTSHFVYISLTNERLHRGISSQMSFFQNIPSGIRSEWNEAHLDGGCVQSVIVESDAPLAMVQLFSDYATQAHISCPVLDTQEHLIGYVGVDFVRQDLAETNDLDVVVRDVRRSANTIGFILSAN